MRCTTAITRFFFTLEWASCPIAGTNRLLGWDKTTFVPHGQWLLSPVLKKLVLESNEEVFFVLL